jgi:hypothetical protein
MRELLWKEWNDIPQKIKMRMLDCQVEQGNPRNPEVFSNYLYACKDEGGFDWWQTIEGDEAWEFALYDKNFKFLYDTNQNLKP